MMNQSDLASVDEKCKLVRRFKARLRQISYPCNLADAMSSRR